jgi:hypothetical protein
VSLFREFSESFNVLVPYRAYSAATLLALGADEIVMHPFGELGPIDPTVGNDFNPIDPATGRRIGISVEDVKAYVKFIKTGVGITHEDELVKAIEVLANKVHPLALGNVERFISQSRMMATKIMRTHMKDAADHTIKEIVENMASNLFFHGHPINRQEAKDDLKLKISNPSAELESAMWELFLDVEVEFENLKEFNPALELASAPDPANGPKLLTSSLVHVIVESVPIASRYSSTRRYRLIQGPQPGQVGIQEEMLTQGWSHSATAPDETPAQASSKPTAEIPPARKGTGKRQAKKSQPAKA